MKTTLTKLLLTSASALFLLSQEVEAVRPPTDGNKVSPHVKRSRHQQNEEATPNQATPGALHQKSPQTEAKIVYGTQKEVQPVVAAMRRVRESLKSQGTQGD